METPKISVIMTTYKRPEMLKRAIQSVINQTFKDWELIIVDDDPKGAAPDIKDPRILYTYHKKNFGNDTRGKNEGIIMASTDLISYLDDDNEYYADHLMILYKEHMKNPGVDVIYGDRLAVDDSGQMDPQIGTNSDHRIDLIFQQNFIDTSDVLIKKQALYDIGGWDERYPKYVDWNLFLRLTKANKKFRHVPKVITTYHLHQGMKSVTVQDEEVGTRPLSQTPEAVFRPKWNARSLEIFLPFLGGEWKPKVAVFTLTMNRLELTQKMYASLQKAGYDYDWFVVDNGSTDGTVNWVTGKAHHVTINPENRGISIASNQALDAIGDKYDIIIKIDNDCELLTTDWLKKMLTIFESEWMLVLSPQIEGLNENAGGTPREAYANLKGHVIGITTHIGGIFTMAHRMAYDGFRWDTEDFMHSLQDLVFTQAMGKKGFLCAYVEDIRASHQETTEGQKKLYPEYFEKRKYERTHSYKPKSNPNTKEYWDSTYAKERDLDDHYRNDQAMFAYIEKENPQGKILDIGCGNGFLLKTLEKEGRELYGVDLSQEGVDQTSKRVPAAKVTRADSHNLPFEDGEFDYTLSTEFLEHVTDPLNVIKEIARVTKKGGQSIHQTPFEDTVPSGEHVSFYTEDIIKELFLKQFSSVEVEKIKHPLIMRNDPHEGQEHSYILHIKAIK